MKLTQITTLFKERRIMMGLTQHEVAERAGLTRSNYSLIETGRHANFQIDTLQKLMDLFRIKIEIV